MTMIVKTPTIHTPTVAVATATRIIASTTRFGRSCWDTVSSFLEG